MQDTQALTFTSLTNNEIINECHSARDEGSTLRPATAIDQWAWLYTSL